MEDRVARKIKDRYRVQSLIGRGGMAEVYKVWDEVRADTLAMKVLREDLAQDKIFLRRFEREAQTLAKLQHRSIVRFYGLERDDLLVFLLMDYIEGTSLREEIFRANSPFSVGKVLEVLRPVCAAMHYAHQMGIVHCDLKPGNILIDHHGEYLVTDFGIARMMDAATSTMVGIGTPAYMAPELVKGEDPTPQTDVYALGVILYEMLSGGERPFTGERAETTGTTAERIRWEQMKLDPKPLDDYNSTVPTTVKAVVKRCLTKITTHRYADIQEVYEEMQQLEDAEFLSRISSSKTSTDIDSHAVENPNMLNQEKSKSGKMEPLRHKEKQNFSSPAQHFRIPLLEHLHTDFGEIYDFDIYKHNVIISSEKDILIREIRKQQLIKTIPIQGQHDQVRFLLGGNSILVNKINSLVNIRIEDEEIIKYLVPPNSRSIIELDLSETGGHCVGIFNDGLIYYWELKSDKVLSWSSIYCETSTHVKLIPASDLLVKVSDLASIQLLSLDPLEKKYSILNDVPNGQKRVACSPNGRFLFVWNDQSYHCLFKIEKLITKLIGYSFTKNLPLLFDDIDQLVSSISNSLLSSAISTAAFYPNEDYLLLITRQGNFSIWGTKSFNQYKNQDTEVIGIDRAMFSSDGKYLITLCKNHRLDYWKVNYQG